MPSNHETLLRQWQMLRLIPRYPQKITATQLKKRLDAEDFNVTKRTVERDLNDLSLAFPLCVDDRSRPHGWSWQQDAPTFDLPGLGNNEALAMMMVEQYLGTLLPATTRDILAPYFKAARQHLEAIPKSHHVQSWLNKVRTVSPSQPLIPPKINPEVQRVVSDALLNDRQLNIRYRRRGDGEAFEYRIHPLALIQRGGIIYLDVRFFDYEDTRTLALHRIDSAEILDEPTQYPPGFNIDEEVFKGRFGFGDGSMITFRARFRFEYGEHLYETPLSEDQKIEEMADGNLMVAATVADTPQLRWWALGFGDGVEVLEPAELRGWVVEVVQGMAKIYQQEQGE
jgi:predicted DNA-binding transcriptional regulator YafY